MLLMIGILHDLKHGNPRDGDGGSIVGARKLEYDCRPTPKAGEEGKPAYICRPRPIFHVLESTVYAILYCTRLYHTNVLGGMVV